MGQYYASKDFVNDNTIPLPVVMITDERLCNVFSYGEVILYSLIKYRMRLSAMNCTQYEDENGLFVIYSQKKLAEMLHKDERTVKRWFKNLKDSGWIMTVQTGVGECSKIYLKNTYTLVENAESGGTKMSPVGGKNVTRGGTKMSPVGGQKCHPTYIENKDIRTNTENNIKELKEENPKTLSVNEQIELFCGFSTELKEALMDWKEFREKVKAPLTKAATNRNLLKLLKISGGDVQTMIEIVNQSVDRGWKGLFALKSDTRNTVSKAQKVYNKLKGEENGEIDEDFSDII